MDQSSRSPGTLDYQGPQPPPPSPIARTSRLAVGALIASILCSPCVLAVILWVGWSVPFDRGVWRRDHVKFWVIWGAMSMATTLSLVALVRIHRSRERVRGRLRGGTMAYAALIISLLWWIILLGIARRYW